MLAATVKRRSRLISGGIYNQHSVCSAKLSRQECGRVFTRGAIGWNAPSRTYGAHKRSTGHTEKTGTQTDKTCRGLVGISQVIDGQISRGSSPEAVSRENVFVYLRRAPRYLPRQTVEYRIILEVF